MRHQNDACPSPSSAAAATPITTTSRRPRPRSNLEILNSTQMSSTVATADHHQQQQQQYHRCCRQISNRDKSPSEQHHHHHHRQQQHRPALETASSRLASSASVVDRMKQDTRVEIMTIAAASSIKVESGDRCGDRAEDHDPSGATNLQGQRLSRKRKRAKTCSTSTRDYSASESLAIDTCPSSGHHEDDSVFDEVGPRTNPTETVMLPNNKIKLEPLTPVQSPGGHHHHHHHQTSDNPISDEESIQLTMSPPMTPLSANELDDTTPTEAASAATTATTTTTTTTTPHHPTNHQRQAGSIERTQQQQHLINRVNHRQQQQQNLPEKITEAQLDRLNTLIKIIRQGSYNEFTELLAERTFKNILNVFVDGHTALHYTLIYGRSLAWCKQLVSNGANPNLTNRAGWHPIHLAAFNGSRETMRYLIDCIAN